MIRAHILQERQIVMPIYDASSLTKGEPLQWGADAGSYSGTPLNTLVKITGNDPTDIFAILAETPSDSTTANRQTPVITRALVQLTENHKAWKIFYDLAAANDLDVTSSTSTILTHGSGDQDLDGGWIYSNSGTGAGQLRYIKAANATTNAVMPVVCIPVLLKCAPGRAAFYAMKTCDNIFSVRRQKWLIRR